MEFRQKHSKIYHGLLLIAVASIYAALAAITMYPLSFNLGDHTFGGLSDPAANIWTLHWVHHSFSTNPFALFHSNRLYPMENSYAAVYNPIPFEIIFGPVYEFTGNQVYAANVTFIATYVLCAIAMFILLYHWTGHIPASFLGGCIFAFSPIRLPSEQIRLLGFFWTPPAIMFFDRYLRSMKFKELFWCVLFMILQVLTSIELAYFLFFILLFYFFYMKNWSFFKNKRVLIHGIAGIMLFSLITLPFMYPYWALQKRYGFSRSIGETIQFSADPIGSYLRANKSNRLYGGINVVDEYNPLPGEEALFGFALKIAAKMVGEEFIEKKLAIDRLPGKSIEDKISLQKFFSIWNARSEKALFQGFLSILFGISGILFFRRQPNDFLCKIGKTFCGILLFAFILSLGPVLIIWGHLTYIPMPYLIFYYVIPGFSVLRGVYRFGFLVSLALSILGGFGIWDLDKKRNGSKSLFIRSRLFKHMTGILFLTIIMAESWCVPVPATSVPVRDKVPGVYRWLGHQEINGAVFFIPTIKGSLSKYDPNPEYAINRKKYSDREIMYMYYSTYHFKKMVNGLASFMAPEWERMFQNLYRLPDSSAVEFFKSCNVNTFILFTDEFEPEDNAIWTRENIERMGFKTVYEDGPTIVLQFKTE